MNDGFKNKYWDSTSKIGGFDKQKLDENKCTGDQMAYDGICPPTNTLCRVSLSVGGWYQINQLYSSKDCWPSIV
jgi:hypothetical protein